jgi:glycogen(starch) synthase
MNIAIFTHSYLPDTGGLEEAIRNLSCEYAKKQHRTIIVVFCHKPGIKFLEVIDGVNVYRIKVPFQILPGKSWKGFIRGVNLTFSLLPTINKLRNLVKQERIEIINAQFMGINAFFAWLVSISSGTPLVVTMQGFNVHILPYLRGTEKRIVKIIFKAILARAAFVTACSRYLLNTALDIDSSLAGKSAVIFNGVNPDEFDQNHKSLLDHPYILCLGRLHSPFKGFDLALFAFKDILDKDYDIKLVIAGTGPDSLYYQRLAVLLGIEKKVLFFGRADRSQAVNLFCNCEFFVMPSRVEPFGIVNLEAMASGKAVLAARTGGIPEIINNQEDGLLFEVGNEDSLAKGMELLLKDKDLRERLGRAALNKIRKGSFSWDNISARYLDIFNRVLVKHAQN